MLYRMYTRYAERVGYKVIEVDKLAGDEAGIKRKQPVKVLYLALYSRQLPIYLLGVVHIVPKSVLGLLLFKLFGF